MATRIKRLKLPTELDEAEEPHKVRIRVSTITGRKLQLSVDVDDLVVRVKEYLEQSSSIPVAQQRLVFNGRVMADFNVLRQYGIRDGSQVFMVAQLVGG